MGCGFSEQLEAYHDGELPSAAASALEAHLPTCPACTSRLAELAQMSNLFAAASVPHLSQISLHRLHHKVADEMDRGLVRLAWGLSAVAASIMVVASAWLMQIKPVPTAAPTITAQAAPPWVGVPTSFESDTVSHEVATPVGQWYLADASSRSDDAP
jgi:anti-sigma factor RsiW